MNSKHPAPNSATRRASGKRLVLLGACVFLATFALIQFVTSHNSDATTAAAPTSIHYAVPADQELIPEPTKRSVVPTDVSGMDPASQGILNYIRVRDAIPDYVIQSLFKRKQFDPD